MALESRGRRWVAIQGIITLNLIVFLITAIMISSFWDSINSFLGDATGFAGNYVLGIVILSLAPIVFSLTGFLLSLREIILDGSHKIRKRITIPSLIFAMIFDLLLITLTLIWGNDGIIVSNALEYQLPFILLISNIGFLVFLIDLLPSLSVILRDIRSMGIQSSLKGASIFSILVILWMGLLITPIGFLPSNVYAEPLSQKPSLIAHRCGSHLGPENTLEAAAAALDYDIAGIEIDVRISSDGVPFLLHDDTLERTTNVAAEFPSRVSDNAETFTIDELQQLDAGSWFFWNDPYQTIQNGLVGSTMADSYLSARIPTLQNATDFAVDNDIILNVDFYEPPHEHPYYSSYLNTCLSILGNGGLHENVWITSRNTTWLEITKQSYPEMITVLTIDAPSIDDIENFDTLDYDLLNTRMGLTNDIFHRIESQNILVSTWTVNAEFRFSQLWCLGIDYITTDIPHLLDVLDYPSWSIRNETYLSLWIVYGCSTLLIVGYGLYKRRLP